MQPSCPIKLPHLASLSFHSLSLLFGRNLLAFAGKCKSNDLGSSTLPNVLLPFFRASLDFLLKSSESEEE